MSDEPLTRADRLAIDRTRFAAERSLMAWIRTALSMIAFGFTIYTFLKMMQQQSEVPIHRPHAPRNVGLILVSIGTFAVTIACFQYWRFMKTLAPVIPPRRLDLALIVGVMVGVLGGLVIASIFARVVPFP